jgi:3-methyladenine DNA glycosylase AlkD
VITTNPDAARFIRRLDELRAGGQRPPMRAIFALAKEFVAMQSAEIETLLERPEHEARVGAVSIMDYQARTRGITQARRKELYDLYVRRHELIDTWDLVDRAAPSVIGTYLTDKPRDQLYAFARSPNAAERRTAMVATYAFIRNDDVEDAFAIAEILATDQNAVVHKAVGGWIREAGKHDPNQLRRFLDRHAATMPRTALRYAVEHLDRDERDHYLRMNRP